jgi:hypothetical protein
MNPSRSQRHRLSHVDDPKPALRLAPRCQPPRPRWRLLYGTVALVLLAGAAAHSVSSGGFTRLVDAASALASFAALAGWVRANRLALSRLEEPTIGTESRIVRVIRSRAPSVTTTPDQAAADTDDERATLPYDFR